MQSTIHQHLSALSQKIGPRPIGSAQNHAAAEYIQKVFDAAGLQTERQEFPCVAWQLDEVRLALEGVALAAIANTFSPPCNVAAPTVALSTFCQLENTDLAQKIALLCGELALGPVAPLNSPIYLPDEQKRLGELLRAKNPLATVMISQEMHNPIAMFDDWTLPIPSVTVSAPVGQILLHQVGQSLQLTVQSQRRQGTSSNVIARVDHGAEKRMVICAHYDTKFGTPGAFDNGSGVAALLALVEALPKEMQNVDLEFIAFSGEEYSGLGDAAYLDSFGLKPVRFGHARKERSEPLTPIHLAINLDGIGLISGTNTVSLVHESTALQEIVSSVLRTYPAISQVAPWPASNHYTFYSHGVPCVVLGNSGGADIIHRSMDTVEWLSVSKIYEAVQFVVDIIRAQRT